MALMRNQQQTTHIFHNDLAAVSTTRKFGTVIIFSSADASIVVGKDRTFPLNELSEQEHRQALEAAFGNNVIQGYPNIIAALKTGYASIGYERGRNKLVDLRKFLENKRMIIPEGKGWRYNPDLS